MIIAIPVTGGNISPFFDYANKLMIIELGENNKIEKKSINNITNLPGHSRIHYLAHNKVNVLICAGISRFLYRLANMHEIKVLSGVMGETDIIISAFLTNKLNNHNFWMPGACQHRKKWQHRRWGHKHRYGHKSH